MDNNPKKEKKGLSEYSQELIRDTQELTAGLFPDEKSVDDEKELDAMAVVKELIRTCIIAILKDMTSEEIRKFKENPGDLKNILQLSVEKIQLSEEEKNSIKKKIDSIAPEDLISQGLIVDKLSLLDLDSDVFKMGEILYKSFEENSEVVQAHAFMNLTER